MSLLLSKVALIVAFLVLVQVHACTARHSFRSLISSKLQDAEKTKLVHEMYVNSIEDTTSSAEDISIATFNKNTSRRLMESEGLKGKPKSMMESNGQSQNETKEATNVNEGEPVEEAVVMDYVQIHRKSPIHNHH